MKRLFSLLMIGLLLMTTAPITAQDNQGGECTVRASNEFARVRATWNLEADEIARIGANDTARYVARGKNASEGFTWYYIGIGWVRADVVTATGDCDDLPVVFTRINSAFNSDLYPCPADFSGYLAPRLASGQTALTVNDHGAALGDGAGDVLERALQKEPGGGEVGGRRGEPDLPAHQVALPLPAVGHHPRRHPLLEPREHAFGRAEHGRRAGQREHRHERRPVERGRVDA